MNHIFIFYFVITVFFCCYVSCQEKLQIIINSDTNNQSEGSSKDLSKAATTEKSPETSQQLICPVQDGRWSFLPLPCSTNKDCRLFGKDILCCEKRCLKGVPPPTPKPEHSSTLFGFVQQTCPKAPLPEIWEIKECVTDADCAPRICCPETLKTGENISYCRTAEPVWDNIPAPKQLVAPIRGLVGYMQCTPPPPALIDLFPKPCQTPLDCFPNLCCQEGGKRYCRPPKRSLLTLIADIGQRIIPTDAAREFIKRIS